MLSNVASGYHAGQHRFRTYSFNLSNIIERLLIKRVAQVNTAHLLAQPHLISTNLYNNHHSEPGEIELSGSLTTMKLKKPLPSRLVGGVETWNRLVPYPRVVDKNPGGISRVWGVQLHTKSCTAQASSAKKISPHDFWLQKPAEIKLVEETLGVSSSSS